MVQKFYALWQKDRHAKVINAFEALRLVDNADILTKPKERSVLFDIDTQLNVYPVKSKIKNGQPYFRYYSSDNDMVYQKKETIVYTPELITFLGAFEQITKFIIKDIETNDVVTIFPYKMEKLKRINFKSDYYEENYAILKFYVHIAYTYPYSNYYKWNGHLGIEFIVSSHSSPPKRRELGEQGIPLFESQANFPKYINIPSEFYTEEHYAQISLQIRNTYQHTNYQLFGVFRNQHIIDVKNKEKYSVLKTYEEQCYALELKLQSLQKKYQHYENLLDQLIKKCETVEKRIAVYKANEEYYKQLEIDNDELKDKNIKLVDKNTKLIQKNGVLLTQKKDVETQLNRVKNRSLLQRILNKD